MREPEPQIDDDDAIKIIEMGDYCKEHLIVSIIVGMGVVPQEVWWVGDAKWSCTVVPFGWVIDA